MQRAATATSLKIVLLLHEVTKKNFHAVVKHKKERERRTAKVSSRDDLT
jgi:hypothetical protein